MTNIVEATKAAPPLSVTGLALAGIPLEEWVLLLTLLYTIFLLIDKFPVVLQRLVALGRWVKGLYGRIR